MERLPAELVCLFLRCAAMEFVCTDREWVVQLALVSHFVHELVSPILYHTMFVTRRNHLKVEALSDAGDKSAHIFRAVRWLVADDWLDPWADDGRWRLFSNVTSVDASFRLIVMLSSNPESRVRRLAVRYGSLFELPVSTLASITHITQYASSINHPVVVDYLAQRLGKLLDAMPALTHVAFEVLNVTHHRASSDESDESDAGAALDLPHELASIENTLRAALKRPRIEVVAARVATPYLPHWPAILGAMTQFKDTRLSAWQDTRRIDSWEKEVQHSAADAMAGRTIWTEARQVWHPDA